MLQKVSIQNFKSLKDVTLELQKVNLLIGPNNSGKSNFLKALESFKFIPKNSPNQYEILQTLVSTSDFFQKDIEQEIVFEIILNQLNNGDNQKYMSLIKIKNGRHHDNNEGLHFLELKFGLNRIPEENYHFDMDSENGYMPVFQYFTDFFQGSEIYKINPYKLTNSFPILPNQYHVNNDASNLIAFFDILRDEYPENFRAIENDLNKCIPELSGLRFENVAVEKENDLYKIFGDKTFKRLGLFDANNKVTYWADELSEGTLYFLALLCIVHQPNPPKLLLLEEPEKGIHPRRIREVMDFIFQLAEDKNIQIIMTTHSERVLDEFEDIPEAVFVFDKDEEGATQVKNLLKDIIEPSNEKMDANDLPRIKFVESLGSHWVTGFIGGVPR